MSPEKLFQYGQHPGRTGGCARRCWTALWGAGLAAAMLLAPLPAVAKPKANPAAAPAKAPAVQIKDIRFTSAEHEVRVEILANQRLSQRVVTRNGSDLVLSLEGVQLPRMLQRVLDTSAFPGPVKKVSSYVYDPGRNTVHVKVSLRELKAPSKLRIKGNLLIWAFSTDTGASAPAPASGAKSAKAAAMDYGKQRVAGDRTPGRKRQLYTGRRIDLDFKDADIHNILRLIAEVGNVNVVTADNVKGRVTIRMKNVAWDQALDVILRAKSLGQVREGNLVRVAPLTDLEKEREAEIARQKQMLMLKPLETRLIPISYADAAKILSKLRYTMSPRGKLTYDDRTNMVIARDTASNLDLMEKLIANLDTRTPQVLIESRIVEARTQFSREVGVQWGGSFVASSGTGNSTGLVFPNQIGIGGGSNSPNATQNSPTGGILLGQGANPNFAVDLPASVSTGAGGALGLTLGSVGGAFNLNLRISAAETQGDVRIISAPRIVTLDNKTATIKSGVSIPFSQVSALGVQTTFKEAMLSLQVKPHVTADGSIILDVEVMRDEPDFVNTGPRGDPTILKKEAKTQMLVKDGDTVVIGGIYTTRKGTSWRKVPWLAEIPILGHLFKYNRKTTDRTEVLIFISPKIVTQPRVAASR